MASVEGLYYNEIEGIFNQIARKQENKHWFQAERISIDEIAMPKGHQDYKAVICDLDKKANRSY
ncbi:hypothetical protein [Laspinema olomoucense]|uniref:hypothetical protein n=1 Tax=Laspinema olomoucense TaxID=3231600 RepID=UPI0021BB5CE1|nr:hypothetical protein [Laspinema sp. D3d]MCT7975677.1 hypothetical protein [Laspinema sp. D3d]